MLDLTAIETSFPEKVLLILTSRLSVQGKEVRDIERLSNDKRINWFEFYKLCLYHKTAILCWKNIKSITNVPLPKYLNDVLQYMYICTKKRNDKNREQIELLCKKCSDRGITIIPVKGAYLIDSLYKDNGIRYTGDMDFLVKYEDISGLNKVLKEMGYVNGTYQSKTGEIKLLSRTDEIKWKMYMSNLPPYYKLSDSDIFPYYKMDFRYALDDTLNKEPIREIVNTTIANGATLPGHYLVHLCTHFYDEAKHSTTIAMAKDLNMIKLCDIREYILQKISERDFDIAVEFCHKYNLEKALYYTLYCLDEIYSDGYEKERMKKLNIEDSSFLNTFGDSTLEATETFTSTFLERFFSCGTNDELKVEPKFWQKI